MSWNRLRIFEDLHKGQSCVLVCNGPSLNDMDLSFLRGRVTFGLNKIYLGLERFGFYPRYLVAINDKVIGQSSAEFGAMDTVKFISDDCADILPEDNFTYHIRTSDLEQRFYHDITQGVRGGHTVTHAALQIIRYMGFQEVVIVGMDHRFDYVGDPNEAQFLDGEDPNHFSAEYFSNQHWDNPNLKESEVSYEASRQVFEKEGRTIIDATLNGACTVFQKADYRDVFGLPKDAESPQPVVP